MTATPAQVAAVNTRFWYLGYRRRDRAARLAAAAALLGLDELASTKDLSPSQAGQLVRALAQFRTAAELRAALAPPLSARPAQQGGRASAAGMSETQLNREIRAACERLGLHAFSATTYRIPGASARPGSSKGFPDWVIAGPHGILFREAKAEDGRRSMAQIRWGNVLALCGDYAVWRPSDHASGRIEHELRAIAGTG